MENHVANDPVAISVRSYFAKVANIFSKNKSQLYSTVFHHLLFPLQIGFYTCVVPFRIKRSQNGTYTTHTNVLQQIVTATLTLIISISIIRTQFLGLEYGQNVIQNPQRFVKMLSGLSKIPFYFTSIYIFWTKRRKIESLLKFSQTGENKEERNFRTILVNIAVILLITHSFGTSVYKWYRLYTFDSWLTYGAEFAVKVFDLKDTLNLTDLDGTNATAGEHFPLELKILGVFLYIVSIYTYYEEDFFALSILVAAIMIYHCCDGFFYELHSKKTDISQISEHYLKVRQTTRIINSFFGPLIFVYVLDLLTTCLSTPFELAQKGRDIDLNLLIYSFILKFFVVIVIAAKAHAKTKHLKEWLFHYKIDEVNVLENESTSKIRDNNLYEILSKDNELTKIGLGCHLFTVTYGFIGLLFSVLATYGAIQLQFYNAANSK